MHGTELWRSDGTAAGTLRLVDLVPGPASGNYSGTLGGGLVGAGGRVFFVVQRSGGWELWTSDGTRAGTAAIAASPRRCRCRG